VKPKPQSVSPGSPAVADEQLRQWVAQWRVTGAELKKQKRAELRALSDEDAFLQASSLMQSIGPDAWINPRRRDWSGLVEQQNIFRKVGVKAR
jgi:hypothetical protein